MYLQTIWRNKNITCTCDWSTYNPFNYINGETICKHIKKFMEKMYDKRKRQI